MDCTTMSNEQNDLKMFKAELSTLDESNPKFFLKNGLNKYRMAPSTNDSFSFHKKDASIFNPTNNFSCVMKETPKFGKVQNQKSIPSANMIKKFTMIKNQIRLKQNMNLILNHISDKPKKDSNSFGSNFKFSYGPKTKKKFRKSSILNNHNLNKMKDLSRKNACHERVQRQKSHCNKRTNKSPKVLGQKHLEIFRSKIISKKSSNLEKFDCFLSSQRQESTNQEIKKKQFKEWQVNLKNSVNSSNKRDSLFQIWKDTNDLCQESILKSTESKIRAKKLPKQFQEEFRSGILKSFRNVRRENGPNTPSDKKSGFFRLKADKEGSIQGTLCSRKNKNSPKINMRYQSASKYNRENRCQNENINRKINYKATKRSNFLMQELRYMIENKKGRSMSKKSPIVPNFDLKM